jgi:hypothetical protein
MRRLPFPAFLLILFACLATPPRAGSVLGDDFNQDEDHDYNGMPKLRLVLSTGYSHWLYNPDSMYKSYERYLNTLESGWNFSGQAVWFPWAQGGIGAEWIWFLSKTSGQGIKASETDVGHTLRDRASYVYYGPTFMSRVQFGRFGLLTGAFGGGILFCRSSFSVDGRSALLQTRTYAFVPQVGWEYSCYRLLSVGINARGIISNFTEYEINGRKVVIEQPEDENWRSQVSMNRLELNASMIFGL